ncbi:TY-Chap domain-containing protein [Nocardia brasiliensis]|uniref:TY-Chap domain-containing protein n=1 Tax=Nocardia brasiliensis TaxID=37326 RepID=UPI0037A8EE06
MGEDKMIRREHGHRPPLSRTGDPSLDRAFNDVNALADATPMPSVNADSILRTVLRPLESLPSSWGQFVTALARVLSESPPRCTLIISATGNRFVRLQQFDIQLSAELPGNEHLAEPVPEAAAQRLQQLGWSAPQDKIENWRRTLIWPIDFREMHSFAHAVAIGLHDALGIGSPDELSVIGWSEAAGDLDLSVLGERLGIRDG